MRILTSLAIFFIAVSCGYEKRKKAPEVSPDEQTIEVGAQSEYVLDPTRSNKLLQASQITVTVTARDEEKTSFKVEGYAKTNFGHNKFTIEKNVPNLVLDPDFMIQLRENGAYQNEGFLLTYLGLEEGDCDIFQVSNIKDFEWVKVDATLCLAAKNVPELKAEFKLYGYKINATYLLK